MFVHIEDAWEDVDELRPLKAHQSQPVLVTNGANEAKQLVLVTNGANEAKYQSWSQAELTNLNISPGHQRSRRS